MSNTQHALFLDENHPLYADLIGQLNNPLTMINESLASDPDANPDPFVTAIRFTEGRIEIDYEPNHSAA